MQGPRAACHAKQHGAVGRAAWKTAAVHVVLTVTTTSTSHVFKAGGLVVLVEIGLEGERLVAALALEVLEG